MKNGRSYALTKLVNRNGYLCYNKDIARIKGVNYAVLFAELINIADMFNGEEFFFEQDKLANDTGLSKHQIQEAIKSMVSDKVLFVARKGLPCKNWYTIDIEAILMMIENSKTSGEETEKQEVEKLDHWQSKNSPTSGENNPPLLNKEIQERDTYLEHTEETQEEIPCAGGHPFPELPDEQRAELLTDQNKHYSKLVFDVWENARLPGYKKGFLNFHIRDFRLALSDLQSQNLHSDDVIQACKNYASVIDLKRQGKTWWSSESLFYNFVKPTTIGQFLPDSFDIERFKKSDGGGSAISRSGEYSNVEIDF